MTIKTEAMGVYQTNCYIVTIDKKDIIIDAGVGATPWIIKNVTNPIAILNTHGHFDHIWSNAELKKHFNIPIYKFPKNYLTIFPTSSKNSPIISSCTCTVFAPICGVINTFSCFNNCLFIFSM